MQTYKAPDNSLHVIDPEFAHLLPAGCVEITEAEADAIRTASQKEPIESWRERAVVSRFQARAALHLAGLLDSVEAMMANPATEPLAKLAWQDAQEFKRTSPTVTSMALALGLTDAQLDDLFKMAATIDA